MKLFNLSSQKDEQIYAAEARPNDNGYPLDVNHFRTGKHAIEDKRPDKKKAKALSSTNLPIRV